MAHRKQHYGDLADPAQAVRRYFSVRDSSEFPERVHQLRAGPGDEGPLAAAAPSTTQALGEWPGSSIHGVPRSTGKPRPHVSAATRG
jgi:hypothetical protein